MLNQHRITWCKEIYHIWVWISKKLCKASNLLLNKPLLVSKFLNPSKHWKFFQISVFKFRAVASRCDIKQSILFATINSCGLKSKGTTIVCIIQIYFVLALSCCWFKTVKCNYEKCWTLISMKKKTIAERQYKSS